MNVRTKLIIGFSIIVVLLWMIAFFVGMGYRNLQQQFMSVGDEIITETLFVTNVESLATETYRYTLDYMLHGSEEARLNTLSILDRLEVIEEMNPPVNITTGEAEPVDKQQFIVAVSQFHFAVSNIIKVKENGASIEDLLVMDQIVGLPALLSLQQSASILKADNNTALAVVKTDFNRTYYAGLNSIIASMVVITLIGLLAAILTTRSIIKPLNKLRKGTEMIAKGNLDYKVGTNARDEIGQLSRAFDQMTEGLTTTMTSVDNLNAEIDERKKAEEDLRASQEFITSLLENAPHQLLVINPDTSIRYVNPKFEEANGWTLDEVVGLKAPYPWWTDELRTEEGIERFKQTITMESGRVENQARKKNGETYWLELSWVGVKHEGKLQYCLISSIDITERKQAEEALRESEDKFSKAFRSSPNTIVITALKDGRFIEANDSFTDVTGYTREEVIGHNSKDIRIWANTKDRNKMLQILKHEGRVHNQEFDFQVKSGEIRTWLFSAEHIDIGNEPCMISMTTDITELKRAEQALKESEEFSSSLMRNSAVPILVISEDTSMKYVNPSFEKLTGFTSEEIIGQKTPRPWWLENKNSGSIDGLKRLINDGTRKLEKLFRKKNGEEFWVEVTSAPVIREGKKEYSLANWLDITDRKKMENELRVHRDNLEEMVRERTIELTDVNKRLQHELKEREKAEIALLSAKDEAEKANRAKSEFLARTSHEIRTPIHGVLGTINLVLDSKLEQDQRQYLNLAMTSAEALLAIINDILDLSKIEAGQLAPESEGFNLRTTLEDTFDSLAVDAYKKDVELTYHLVNGISTELIGDSRYLRQVLINLVGNAVKFTEKGEIAVIVESITDNKKETDLHFSVRDTGIGIPKNKHNMIFDPFQQADGSINRKYGGTGLGLTISRHLVQQMGGDIWVESDKKSGTTFHFTGKYTKQKNGKRSRNNSKKMADINNIPVLLIEDNATNSLMMKDMLEKWGCKVTDAESGPAAFDAIKKAKAASIHYSIIILDKTIPDMDGFTIAKLMLNNSTKPSDIIMMLPPHNVSDDFSRCQKIGISNYIIKPIKESELLKGLLLTLGLAQESEERKSIGIDHKEQLLPSLRILVAEDNPTSQLIARKTLEKMGHNVTIANNGSEAIKMYKKNEYDLVLMDAEMPVLNGLETTRRIREAEAESGQHIPIVAMTAYAMEEDKNRCLSAGMDTYLSKPAKPEEITAVIEGLFISEKQPGEVSESGDAVKSEEVPAVDIEAARRVFGDDDDLFSEAVDLFLAEDYPEQLRLLKDGIDSQDASAVRAAAHSIKGASRSLGGMVLGDICQSLEELSREEKLGDARALLRLIEIETERFADYYSSSESNQVEQPAKQ